MNFKEECSEVTNNRLITFSEKRSKLTLINEQRDDVTKVTIDNCQITEGIRCDYFAYKDPIEYYIELKGQDVEHAIKQILNTVRIISKNHKYAVKVCFVICTRSPINSAEIQNIQKKLKQSNNISLLVRSTDFKYSI